MGDGDGDEEGDGEGETAGEGEGGGVSVWVCAREKADGRMQKAVSRRHKAADRMRSGDGETGGLGDIDRKI